MDAIATEQFNHTIYSENKCNRLCSSKVFILLFILIIIQISVADSKDHYLPNNGSLYNGAFTPVQYHHHEMELTHESISSYVNNSGRSLAIIALSHEWSVNRSFPLDQVHAIQSFGAIPYIRLMMRNNIEQYQAEPIYTLKRIRDGMYDTELRQFARVARSISSPILIEYGTEMNGWWFSWNGYWTGREEGPALFQSSYRHIIDIMKEEEAENLIWVFHINWHSNPEEEWNIPEAYYPGDDYIDIIGVSAYGALLPEDKGTLPFSYMMDKGYVLAKNISPVKPVFVSEFGTDLNNKCSSATAWTEEAFKALFDEKRWPDIIGFVWWNAGWPHDNNPANNTTMRIEEDEKMRNLFQRCLASDKVLEKYCEKQS